MGSLRPSLEEEEGKEKYSEGREDKEGKAPKRNCAKLRIPVYIVVLHPCGQGRKLPF